jgi:hypothetical protein
MPETHETTYLALASYLVGVRGYPLIDVRVDRPGRATYEIEISPEDWARMKTDFANSECSRFNDSQTKLKSLAY